MTSIDQSNDYLFLIKEQIRRGQFLFQDLENLERREICLEIGPFEGWHTISLLKIFKKVIVIENNLEACDKLNHKFEEYIKNGQLEIIRGDAHYEILKIEHKLDAIVCIGFLYHSPHPLFFLENLLNLNADYILFETFFPKKVDDMQEGIYLLFEHEEINNPGMRFSNEAIIPFNLKINEELLFSTCNKANYKIVKEINKKDFKVSKFILKIDKENYFKKWLKEQKTFFIKRNFKDLYVSNFEKDVCTFIQKNKSVKKVLFITKDEVRYLDQFKSLEIIYLSERPENKILRLKEKFDLVIFDNQNETRHPFWLIENICRLKPANIIFRTSLRDTRDTIFTESYLFIKKYYSKDNSSELDFKIVLTYESIIKSFESLNYQLDENLSGKIPASVRNPLREETDLYNPPYLDYELTFFFNRT